MTIFLSLYSDKLNCSDESNTRRKKLENEIARMDKHECEVSCRFFFISVIN